MSKFVPAPSGRPSKYEDRFVQELIDFFNVEPYKEVTVLDKNGGEKVQLVPNKFPTLARFACNIGVCRDTLYEWSTAKDAKGNLIHEDFSYAYKRAKDYQEAILAEGALVGSYNSTFAIFTAKNVLGWRDKSEEENDNKIVYLVKGGLPD